MVILFAAIGAFFCLATPASAQAWPPVDYRVSASQNQITVTHSGFGNGNNGDLTIYSAGNGIIGFSAGGRTFSYNASPSVTGGVAVSLSAIGEIIIQMGDGDDIVRVGGFSYSLPSLTINGGTGNDTVLFEGEINFAHLKNLNVDLQDDDANPGIDDVFLGQNARLATILGGSVLDDGKITIRCSRTVLLEAGSRIQTQHGALTVEANWQATPTTGNFHGIHSNGTSRSIGDGRIALRGRGGNAPGGFQYGIYLTGAGATFSAGLAASTLEVYGIGGTNPGALLVIIQRLLEIAHRRTLRRRDQRITVGEAIQLHLLIPRRSHRFQRARRIFGDFILQRIKLQPDILPLGIIRLQRPQRRRSKSGSSKSGKKLTAVHKMEFGISAGSEPGLRPRKGGLRRHHA
jgi:hypothetical protein